ncbi:MAG: dihydrofolate reductase [Acidobacteria bacterium]|nr:dihydrofolate reductase [Acidobacteriota bacterium]
MAIIGIIAISKNFAIGRRGKLPWHYSEDLKFFKRTTMDNAIVMGSRTWLSLNGPLPGRENIVLTRSATLTLPDGVRQMSGVDEVLDFDKDYPHDVFVIGGASIFKSFAEVIDRWIVTDIPETIEDADTFMPTDFLFDFDLEETIDLDGGLRVRILHRHRD